jgi:ABC-type nitrate/sulfonate/bicarbonate transport system substrate-binding protein
MVLSLVLASTSQAAESKLPVFTIASSEYPSWATLFAAHHAKLIQQEEGKVGELEQKYGVDVVVEWMDYDSCIGKYASGIVDAVAITNFDVLPVTVGRSSVAFLATSTSFGADMVIGEKKYTNLASLAGVPIHGLKYSVAQYNVERNLEVAGLDPTKFKFVNMDPGTASQQLQTGQLAGVGAIWEPYVTQTLSKSATRNHGIASSRAIPDEIVDMFVVGADVLGRPGGVEGVQCVTDAYYAVNRMLADPATAEKIRGAIAARFADLNDAQVQDMLTRCKFYGTPELGAPIFAESHMAPIIVRQADFHAKYDRFPEGRRPVVGYGSATEVPRSNLRFDPTWMKEFMGSN